VETDTLEMKGIRITTKDLLARMRAGDLLRWVPCAMLGVKAKVKGQRMLRLGNDTLDDESGLGVIRLEREGIIKVQRKTDDNCFNYELKR
jgi:hypothetical protein